MDSFTTTQPEMDNRISKATNGFGEDAPAKLAALEAAINSDGRVKFIIFGGYWATYYLPIHLRI